MKIDRLSVQRGRGANKEIKKKRDKHPPEQQLYGNIRAATYHRQNLLEILREAIGEQDHERAAVAAVTLLAAQDPQYLPGPEKMFGPVEVKHFPEVAAAGFEVLRQEASYEELKRYIRKQQDRQRTPADAELVTFELVYLLAERGEYQDAYDVLDSVNSNSTQEFHRAVVCGFLRHAQVCEILQKAAAQLSRPENGLNMFQYDEQCWTKGGQQLQEFWNSAEQHLKEALKLQPSAVREACLLAQLYMMGGQPEDALDVARALRLVTPADSDAHALFILLKDAEGLTAEDVTETSEAYLDLLKCDPTSEYAVHGLLSLNARVAVAPVTLIEAMALHLDCADVQCPSARQAWTTIAQALNKAAKNVTDLQAEAASACRATTGQTDAAQQQQSSSHCLAEQAGNARASKRQTDGADGQSDRPANGADMPERQAGSADGQAEREPGGNGEDDQQASTSRPSGLEAAWNTWQAFQELLTLQRYWWMKLHFRWQDPSTGLNMSDPQEPSAQMDILRGKAIAAAFMFDTVDDVMAEDPGANFVPRVQDHVEAVGEFGIAEDIADAVELAKAIRNAYKRRTFETECTPFDKPLAKFGVVSNLPQVWWSVFPFKRGKRQHQ